MEIIVNFFDFSQSGTLYLGCAGLMFVLSDLLYDKVKKIMSALYLIIGLVILIVGLLNGYTQGVAAFFPYIIAGGVFFRLLKLKEHEKNK